MSEKRINPDTGVHEEKKWHGWAPRESDEGREQRTNIDTGVHEEKRWHGWAPRESDEGREERTNINTGVHEEKKWHGWTPSENDAGHEQRNNIDTGVHEEKKWHGWTPDVNDAGREERTNTNTGVHEEKRWHGWTPDEHSNRRQCPPPSKRPPEDSSTASAPNSSSNYDNGDGSYTGSLSGGSASSGGGRSDKEAGWGGCVTILIGLVVISAFFDNLGRKDSPTATPASQPSVVSRNDTVPNILVPLPSVEGAATFPLPPDGLPKLSPSMGEAALATYRARISVRDHFTTKGQDLRKVPGIKVADILLQERLNYHRYQLADPEDGADILYARLGHDAFRRSFEDKSVSISPASFGEQTIFSRTPLVEVSVGVSSISVNIIELGNPFPSDQPEFRATGPNRTPQLAAPKPTPLVPSTILAVPPSPAGPKPGTARYAGRGRVYRVPELEGLVGQQLGDAWLQGNFVVRSVRGHIAECVTAAVVLFAKEGNTRVRIEFLGGIHGTQAAIDNTTRTGLVNMIPVPAQNPLQLLGVNRGGDGRLQVRARFHGAYTP